jgi:uncharacterized protein (TIGR02271 family)
MASETIVAVFDTVAGADAAARELESSGVPAAHIKRYTKQSAVEREDVAVGRTKHRSFWSWLLGEEIPEQHYTAYDSALERGGEVLTVIADQGDADRVVSIIENHAPIGLEGEAATGVSTAAPVSSQPLKAEGEQVVPLAEERLDVGKRTVERGTTRVRRYVVERPVEEQIRLRDETVSVERRPVSGSASVAPDAFTEKTVEVTETREEPMVEKVARVVEEVAVGKKASERVETVRDTVRREEVDVERPTTDKPVSPSQGVSTGANRGRGEPPLPPVER